MPRSKSVEVLNEADRFTTQLNWLLFADEQVSRLFAPSKGTNVKGKKDWRPGKPLYKWPMGHMAPFADCSCDECLEQYIVYGISSQYIRPMIQEIYDVHEEWIYRCDPCEVSWDGAEPCWNCGVPQPDWARNGEETKPLLSRVFVDGVELSTPPMSLDFEAIETRMLGYAEADVELTWRMFRGPYNRHMVIVDEAQDFSEVDRQLWAAANPNWIEPDIVIIPTERETYREQALARARRPFNRYWLDRPVTEQRRRREL